ncbi:TetR/AcrR family transcriptional regulator [Streptomyces sp. NPDC050698]
MVRGAAELLARGGLGGTSFREVLQHTSAPRGSVYHHFPGGKQELVTAAVSHTGDSLTAVIDAQAGHPAEDVVAAVAAAMRHALTSSDLAAGCAVAAATVDAASEFPGLTDVAGGVFRDWQDHLAAALHAGGVARPRADTLAVTVIAALEGAIILSRARHDITAYDHVTRELLAVTRAAMSDPA